MQKSENCLPGEHFVGCRRHRAGLLRSCNRACRLLYMYPHWSTTRLGSFPPALKPGNASRTCLKFSSIPAGPRCFPPNEGGLSPGLPGASPAGSHARDIGANVAANDTNPRDRVQLPKSERRRLEQDSRRNLHGRYHSHRAPDSSRACLEGPNQAYGCLHDRRCLLKPIAFKSDPSSGRLT
ncbi:hypothetical protein ABID19_006746 [Mesorhizobium robiniae]|uniref:Uncharacterized protein n=1 Tax=Mesorhizobium robiniae TaxID=559315 RepID=A0ABV2GZG7_9HYPH